MPFEASKKTFIAFALICCAAQATAVRLPCKSNFPKRSAHVIKESDPFAQYINSIPKIIETISLTNTGEGMQAITTKEIVFASKNNINKVYGVMAWPQRAGKFPGLLILHGGSGNASGLRGLVEKFAAKGYVAFANDMPGYCNIEATPHSTGPWKVHPAPDEQPRFNVAESLQNSALLDAEVAGIEAFNLLQGQPNVDAKKMGITGYSWGGYSTTFLSGLLGKKVKAAYSYWGCGYYDKGSFWSGLLKKMPDEAREKWLTYFDAGRRSKNIQAHYFIEAASNDTYFWPEAVSATLHQMPGNKNQVFGPNVNHTEVSTSAMMQALYFDYYLKNEGSPFIKAAIPETTIQNDSSRKVAIKLTMPKGITAQSVQLYYSLPAADWQSRKWIPIEAQGNGDKYAAIIPSAIVNSGIRFFAYVKDSRNVVTSSDLF